MGSEQTALEAVIEQYTKAALAHNAQADEAHRQHQPIRERIHRQHVRKLSEALARERYLAPRYLTPYA